VISVRVERALLPAAFDLFWRFEKKHQRQEQKQSQKQRAGVPAPHERFK
jgi:hypothetical protein